MAIKKILMKHCLDKKPAGTTDAETAPNKRNAKKEANEAYMAMAFISGANRIKYGRLIEELENRYLKGNGNKYPKTGMSFECMSFECMSFECMSFECM